MRQRRLHLAKRARHRAHGRRVETGQQALDLFRRRRGCRRLINTLANRSTTSSSGTSSSGSGTRSTSSEGRRSAFIILILIVGGIIGIGFAVSSSSRRNERAAEQVTLTRTEDAEKKVSQANRQLLAADEQVRSATDELDFARAQFGTRRHRRVRPHPGGRPGLRRALLRHSKADE